MLRLLSKPASWRWPLPALLAWLLCWLVFRALLPHTSALTALGLASGTGVALSVWGGSGWRRLLIGGGFPLSLALAMGPALWHTYTAQPAEGSSALLPAWAWLVPLALLLLVYPMNAWRDAPLFPTPAQALDALPQYAPVVPGGLVLDAGCGAGDGLLALRRAYPHADLHGLEWSWPLRFLAALRCPWARVRHADIWATAWSDCDLVYLFQRPESMTRAAIKAAELRPGAFMVSLEFPATHLRPQAHYVAPGGKTVWIYQAPVQPA